jgi:transposase
MEKIQVMRGIILSDNDFKEQGFEIVRIVQDGYGFEFYQNGYHRLDTVFTFDGIDYHYRYRIMIQDIRLQIGFNVLFNGYINSKEELKTILQQTGVIN